MKIFVLILYLLSTITCYSQFCYVANPASVKLKSASFSYTPGGPTKFVRIIIHFVQKDDGTGNFNEINDGMTPSHNYSGYDYASYIIDYANSLLADNQPMRLQPFGNVPVYDPGYRYVLAGVFFWKNSTYYYDYFALADLMNSYGQSTNDAINIFVTSPHGNVAGYARELGDNAVNLFLPYNNYIASVNNNNGWYNRATATIINHEVGHCFNLSHTVFYNSGGCCDDCDDFCNDTPTIQQMLNLGKPSPCCWNDTFCSNNFMDYNAAQQSITPDQLSIIHFALNNEKINYIECNYQTTNLYINTFGNNSGAYIAKYITVSGTTAIIPNGKTVYLKGNEITLNSGSEVQSGGKLNILSTPACK